MLNTPDGQGAAEAWQVVSYVTCMQVAETKRGHQQYVQRVLDFMTNFDLLCCPCVMVAPFDVDIRSACIALRHSVPVHAPSAGVNCILILCIETHADANAFVQHAAQLCLLMALTSFLIDSFLGQTTRYIRLCCLSKAS